MKDIFLPLHAWTGKKYPQAFFLLHGASTAEEVAAKGLGGITLRAYVAQAAPPRVEEIPVGKLFETLNNTGQKLVEAGQLKEFPSRQPLSEPISEDEYTQLLVGAQTKFDFDEKLCTFRNQASLPAEGILVELKDGNCVLRKVSVPEPTTSSIEIETAADLERVKDFCDPEEIFFLTALLEQNESPQA